MGMIWVGYRRDAATARQLLMDPEATEELLESDDDQTSVDLDKAWHGLHWLLTRSAEPTTDTVSQAIFGGDPVGEDLGYGPGRLLQAPDVKAVAEALADIDVEVLLARMNAVAMDRAGIYPSIWDESDVFDNYLAPAYERLRTFYAAAASMGESVIQTVC